MSVIDFFALEAGEYLERLDGQLARASNAPPALDPLLTDVRALRGAATMARQGPIAEVAEAIERIAKALRDGTVPWDVALQAAMVAAVDDLKILVRNAPSWSALDDQRASARRDELHRFAPAQRRRSSMASSGTSLLYLASEATDVASALESFTQQPAERGSLLIALPRVRALRGMASLRDLPPLAEVVEAIEDAAKPIELGTGTPSTENLALLTAAAALLRRAAIDLRSAGRPDPASPEAAQFAAALDFVLAQEQIGDDVVPISALFFADAGPHVVSAAPNPPTTLAQRFRMEVVSQAEHLQRLVSDARTAADEAARTRAGRSLRGAMHALRFTAISFAETDVARFVETTAGAAAALDTLALGAISEAAALLSNPATNAATLEARLKVLSAGRAVDTAIGAGFSPVTRGTPTSVERTEPKLSGVFGYQADRPAMPMARVTPSMHGAPPLGAPSLAEPRTTPASSATSGADLHALLASGIAGLDNLSKEPFSTPVYIEEEMLPIDEFLYRGRAALDRALELRDEITNRGGPPETAELDELFALLELATTE